MTKFAQNLHRTTSCCMQFTSAKNHWILPTHSNVTSKIVVGLTLRGPPCIFRQCCNVLRWKNILLILFIGLIALNVCQIQSGRRVFLNVLRFDRCRPFVVRLVAESVWPRPCASAAVCCTYGSRACVDKTMHIQNQCIKNHNIFVCIFNCSQLG